MQRTRFMLSMRFFLSFIMRPSYRLNYVFYPSVCLFVCLTVCFSVCPSVCPVRAHNSNTKKRREIRMDVPDGTNKWIANFQLRRSKVKVIACLKPPKSGVMFTYGRKCWQIKRGRRRLQTRSTPLLGLIYCRRLRGSAAR